MIIRNNYKQTRLIWKWDAEFKIFPLNGFLQLESVVQENESIKEKVEELSLELEILRSEVSDGGMEEYDLKR